MTNKKQSIVESILIDKQIITADEAKNFSKEVEDGDESFISLVIKHKKINPTELAISLAKQLHLPFFDIDYLDTSIIQTDIDDIKNIIRDFQSIPIKKTSNEMTILVSSPYSRLDDIQFKTGIKKIQTILVDDSKLKRLVAKLLNGDVQDNSYLEEESSSDDPEEAPVVKFIDKMLFGAISKKASDIHFEPYEQSFRVRYRIDGELITVNTVPVGMKEKIASRIKIQSSMDISEKRVPQDGRMKLKLPRNKSIDFRVSTLPTIFGEKIVMRILDSSSASLDIDKLGYNPEQKKLLLDAVKRPYGMVLVTGPTGSGKTVSLYSCINVLNTDDVNISTAEDPVEIQLPGVNQVNMNDKAGLNFASALKSFLRQDPDTILVGEIRDLETADIAIKAAQTGHMVLSTLHTNDAPKTIARLLNMGVKPFNIASSVILITAQRLARRLCPACKQKDDAITMNVLVENGLPSEEMEGFGNSWHVYKPVGCAECDNKGYKGRVGIYQVMPITEDIRKIILKEGTEIEIAEASRAGGVYSLREAGMVKVKDGVTSMSEVLATTNID